MKVPTTKRISTTEKRINKFIKSMDELFTFKTDIINEINISITELSVDIENNRKEIQFYIKAKEKIVENLRKNLVYRK